MDLSETKVPTVGIELTKEEKLILKYPPKHSIIENLNDSDFKFKVEETNAKVRWEKQDEDTDDKKTKEEPTEEESRIKEATEESSARSRQVYERESMTIDMTKLNEVFPRYQPLL